MKKYKIILFAIVGALLLHGCYDEKMEWGTPEDHNPINSSEIPLNLAEKIANYDFIKAYVPAGMIVGIGAGADLYISDPAYKKVIDENFQMITTGNAMKHSSVVRNNGSLDFTTIDAFIPLEDVRGYATVIRSLTQGRGSFYMEPSHYDPVPRDIQEKLTTKLNGGKN